METPIAIGVAALLGMSLAISASAGKLGNIDKPAVVVCIQSAAAGPWIVVQAERGAARIFESVGVRLDWHEGGRICKAPTADIFQIYLTTGAPLTVFPDALAWTRVGDGTRHIEVFFNRVVEMVEPRLVPALLAHVLAHEITHILEGVSRHSSEGVMKPHWDADDYADMSIKPLPFAPEDAALIRNYFKGNGVSMPESAHR
jgi:hypothetical protein